MVKPKVYICAHPQDLSQYKQMLSEQMRLLLRCEIYTDDELTNDRFIHYWMLRDMRMFLVPVTRRLLTEKNAAMRKIRFAREHQIPVIPWLMEDDLEELFVQRCGEMAYLRRDEPLDTFVKEFRMDRKSVLRIRDAFDGAVYLDTQPHDIRYARQMQGLIHQCSYCENLGFSSDQQPQKGQIYVLVITENMLKNPMSARKRYETAKALNLPTMAVMMYELDLARIQDAFPWVTQAIDPFDEDDLENAMLDALEQAQIRYTYERTPEQTYLLGLAFLNGVDVQMDRSCGVAYIRQAAGEGYQEAREKLISLQHLGDGVGMWRDHNESDFFGF